MQTTSRPLALAHALDTLAHGKVKLGNSHPLLAAMCIAGTGKDTEDLTTWFSTHPNLDKRIERLYRYAGRSRSRRPRSTQRGLLDGLRRSSGDG